MPGDILPPAAVMTADRKVQAIRLAWWPVAVAWVATLGALAMWLGIASNADLRDELSHWQFWVLELQFALLILFTIWQLPRTVRSLDLRGRDVLIPGAASVLIVGLIVGVAPRTNRIYYDEQIYQGIGQSLSDTRLALMCNDGNVEYGSLSCARGEYNKQPYGYPYVLSIGYRILGVRESVPFVINAASGALFVWAVFLITAALTESKQPAQYAALIAALIPEHLRWSHTAAVEPTTALASAIAVLAALGFVRLRSTGALCWTVVASAVAMQFRPECLLVVAAVMTVLMVFAPCEVARPRFWWAGWFGLMLIAMHIGHLVAVRNEGWGTTGATLSFGFVLSNLRANSGFFFGDFRFPVMYTGLALAGLVLHARFRQTAVLLAYFTAFWAIFLFFYAGSYDFGVDDRYSLLVSAPVASLAGIGTWRLVQAAAVPMRGTQRAGLFAAALIGAQFLSYMPFVRATGEEAWAARADVAFSKEVAKRLPANAFVLTQNPTLFHVMGQSAAQTFLAATDAGFVARDLAPRYAGGVYFNWSYWCNVADPVQQSTCSAVLDRFPHLLFAESRTRNFRYAMYRLDLPASDPADHASGSYRHLDQREP